MSLANTSDNEKLRWEFSLLGYNKYQDDARVRQKQRAWTSPASPSSEAKLLQEWMGIGVLITSASPEEESKSHLPTQSVQGQTVAGMGVPCQCRPKLGPTCSYQLLVPVVQQAQGRPPNQLVQMRPNQSGNKV